MQESGFENWTRFVLKVFIRSDIQTVYRSIATTKGLTEWFRKTAFFQREQVVRADSEFAQSGDRYEWTGYNREGLEAGSVLEASPNKVFKFTFCSENVPVTFELEQQGSMTLLRLIQENMPDNPNAHIHWHMSCRLGWTFFLTNLKSFIETGVDLREKDPEKENLDLVNK